MADESMYRKARRATGPESERIVGTPGSGWRLGGDPVGRGPVDRGASPRRRRAFFRVALVQLVEITAFITTPCRLQAAARRTVDRVNRRGRTKFGNFKETPFIQNFEVL